MRPRPPLFSSRLENHEVAFPVTSLKVFSATSTSAKVIERTSADSLKILAWQVKWKEGKPISWAKVGLGDNRSGWIVQEDAGGVWAGRIPVSRLLVEASLVEGVSAYVGWGYAFPGARYPKAIRGLQLPLAPPTVGNCNTFAESITLGAAIGQGLVKSTTLFNHNLWMVIDPVRDAGGPPAAAVQLGLATPLRADAPPGPWQLAFGRHRDGGGHVFWILDHDAASDRVLILECNDFALYGLDGVGFRRLGEIASWPSRHPGADWASMAGVTGAGVMTWAETKALYTRLDRAVLHVRGSSWARGGAAE